MPLAREDGSAARRLRHIAVELVGSEGYDALSDATLSEHAAILRARLADDFGGAQRCLLDAYGGICEHLFAAWPSAFQDTEDFIDATGDAMTSNLEWLAGRPAVARFVMVEAPKASHALQERRLMARRRATRFLAGEHARRGLVLCPLVQFELQLGALFHLSLEWIEQGMSSEPAVMRAEVRRIMELFEPAVA